ncbi:MAG: peptide MFS transporter [Arenicella sp.]|nr:peptide MFS transporter [Arenicella sp.]
MNQTVDTALNEGFFGHPKGLQTLFLTEMWERMSYYGMRGLLVLFMTAALQEGGLALTTATATAIYGLYTASVYFMGLPGGWIADRLIGGQRAIWYGGIIIMSGHIVLAIPSHDTFFIGLILVVLGTGLLKPNIGAVVGQLYSREDQRRDSGYAIYYMGINVGSVIGYTVCGWLAQNAGWHYAFGAAAIGMAFGLVHFRMTTDNLQGVSAEPAVHMSPEGERRSWMIIMAFLVGVVLVTAMTMTGALIIDAPSVAQKTAVLFTAVFFIYFGVVYFRGNLNQTEKKGMWALMLVCVASACFWSGFEQAGSSLNLFARDYTNRVIGGWEVPIIWFQNANPIFIILLTPFFAALWVNLGLRMASPSYGIKCAVGLMIMSTGFIVMVFAAQVAAGGMQAAPFFLILTYFLHTVGELCLSPIALSAVSKLSPQRFIGQMMGVFVLTYSIGNIIAGLLAGNFDPSNVAQMPNLFKQIATFTFGIGAVVLLVALVSRNWEAEVEHAKD